MHFERWLGEPWQITPYARTVCTGYNRVPSFSRSESALTEVTIRSTEIKISYLLILHIYKLSLMISPMSGLIDPGGVGYRLLAN